MKPIAKKEFKLNDFYYEKGDEVKVDNKEQLVKLIERGFIEPLTNKEIQNFDKNIETKIIKKEEE